MFSPIPIVAPKYMENAQTTQYTAVNCRTRIDKAVMVNVSGTNQTASANIVPVGGAAGTSNLVMKARQLAPNETYTCPELVGSYLDVGWFLSTLASAASSIVLYVNGTEYTN